MGYHPPYDQRIPLCRGGIFSGLSAQPQAPHFDIPVNYNFGGNEIVNTSVPIHVDELDQDGYLHDLLSALLCTIFVIALMFLTVRVYEFVFKLI